MLQSHNRFFDAARGSFDPLRRDPELTRENPRGVRHLNKTVQDRLPVADRPRVRAWHESQAR